MVGLGVRFGRAGASVFGGSILFECADQQFELFNVAIELLRRATEPRAPKHGQLHLQLLDVQRFGMDLGGVGGNFESLRASSACRSAAKIRRALGLAGSGSVANDIDGFYKTALSRR